MIVLTSQTQSLNRYSIKKLTAAASKVTCYTTCSCPNVLHLLHQQQRLFSNYHFTSILLPFNLPGENKIVLWGFAIPIIWACFVCFVVSNQKLHTGVTIIMALLKTHVVSTANQHLNIGGALPIIFQQLDGIGQKCSWWQFSQSAVEHLLF